MQLSLFDLDDFKGLDVDKKPEAAVPKANAKKTADKKTVNKKNKKTEPVMFPLPLHVVGSAIDTTIEGTGEMEKMEVCKNLYEQGYEQFAADFSDLILIGNNEALAVIISDSEAMDNLLSWERPLTICRGSVSMELTLDSFDGKEAEEISVADVKNKWVSAYADFINCNMVYDDEANVMYPFLGGLNEKIKGTCRVIDIDGSEKEIHIDKNPDIASIFNTDTKDAVLLVHKKEDSVIMLDAKKTVAVRYRKTFGEKASGRTDKNEKATIKVELPVTLHHNFTGENEELTSERFGGKTRVTLKEIQDEVSKTFPSYTSSTCTFGYMPEKHIVSAMLFSAKKG